jgi:hypothetical protein
MDLRGYVTGLSVHDGVGRLVQTQDVNRSSVDRIDDRVAVSFQPCGSAGSSRGLDSVGRRSHEIL